MTGFLFGAILLLAVACWMKLRDEHLRPYAIAFLAAAPLLLVASIVIWTFARAEAGEYRVALEGVEVDLAADGQAFTVGGGAEGEEADDVIVADLPPRYLTFRVEGGSVVATLPAESERAVANPAYAAVRIDKARPFANSFPTTAYAIPARRQEITENFSIPIWRNLTAETVMYPLRFWSRAHGAGDVGSFLSHDGGFFRRTLFLTLTGDGTRAGDKRYNPRVAVIAPGKPVSFALYRLDYADPAAGTRRSRAQERRSFRASYEKGRLSIVFDTPDYIRLAPKEIAPLVEKEAFLLATRDPRRDVPVIANQMVLSFPQLGPRVQNELFSVIRVSESGDCRMRVTAHTGTRCYASGDAFRIGERAAAIVRVTEIATPWGILASLLALALVSFVWMSRPETNTIALIVVSAAELLLAVRLLIAFEGALLDPAAASGLWESLVAFAALPMVLRGAAASAAGWQAPGRPGAGSTAGEAPALRMAIEAAIPLTIIALALYRANLTWPWILTACAATLLAGAAAFFLPKLLRHLKPVPLKTVLLAGLALALLRVALLFGLGWKERISLPGIDLALTIVYLPAVFVFFALLWERTRGDDAGLTPKRIAAALAAVAVAALLTIFIPWFVKDSGSALVHVPAIVLLFALPLLARPTRTAWALATPLLLVLLVHTIVFFAPHYRGQDRADPAYQKALTDEAEANDYIARRMGQSTNQLRVLSHVAPHQLEEAGTSKAEGLVMQRRVLDRYGSTGIFGAGYLQVPLTTFRDTHMNDNLSAIHILAPFGIAGALGILALLVALALLPLRARFGGDDDPRRAIDARGALGILALWTFSLCGVYMIAANLGLVLFTGKNVYLLAATSKSDAIEGGVLLLLALVALAASKEEEVPA